MNEQNFKHERKIFEVIISLADYFVNKVPSNIHDICMIVCYSIHRLNVKFICLMIMFKFEMKEASLCKLIIQSDHFKLMIVNLYINSYYGKSES